MTMQTKQEILEALTLPPEEYRAALQPEARRVRDEAKGNRIAVSAMLGYDNICRNRCLYCGMRAGSRLERYRYTPDQVLDLCRQAREMGLDRLFLISGEDPKFPFEGLLRMVEGARGMGFSHISLACGEFDRGQYGELKAAGADEYVLKFEMSHRDTFQRLNPSADYDRRMAAMGWIKEAGMSLASGNIVDYPGQTLDELADDILLMQELEISWAPVIPYLPAAGTPLAREGGPGRVELCLREISLVRLLLPACDITAQQPGPDLRQGLSSVEGNRDALLSGANLLFVDLLPAAQAGNFRVMDYRTVQGLEHIRREAALAGMAMPEGLAGETPAPMG